MKKSNLLAVVLMATMVGSQANADTEYTPVETRQVITSEGATFNGNSFTGFSASSGGAINNNAGGTVNIINSLFDSNTATNEGGAILNKGALTITNTKFIDNGIEISDKHDIFGGAIRNLTPGTLTIENSQFIGNYAKGNRAVRGGTIWSSGVMNVTNSIFQKNTGIDTNENGLNMMGSVIQTHASGKLTLTGNTFGGDEKTDGNIGNSTVVGNSGAVIEFSGNTFKNNTAYKEGIVNFQGKGSANVNGIFKNINTFENNSGSAIYTMAASVVEFENGSTTNLINNDVREDKNNTPNGGGLYNTGTMTFKDGSKLVVESNKAVNGGGVYNSSSGTLTIADATFTGNEATENGGAIYNEGTINFNSNATFSGNTVNGLANDIYNTGTINFNAADGVTNEIRLGGGIDGSSGSVNIASTGENKTGVVDLQGNINNQTVNVNSGELDLSNNIVDNSRIVVKSGANLNIEGTVDNYVTLKNGSANDGGAIYNSSKSENNNISYANFTQNAVTNNGGAIYNEGNLAISNSIFSKNTTKSGGGAIYNASAGKLTISDTEFSENSATSGNAYGASIFSYGDMNITNSKFLNNTSIKRTAGIYVSGGNVTINGSEFNNNSSPYMGSAIYEGGKNTTLALNNTSFNGNTGTSTVCVNGSQGANISFDGVTFENNVNPSAEGIIDLMSGVQADFSGSNLFKENTGTALYNWTGSTSTFKNGSTSEFIGNTALTDSNPNGGALFNGANSTVTFENGSSVLFSNNRAKNGGAVYNASTGTMTLADAQFTGNSASALGGAIYNAGTMTINAVKSDVIFTGNTVGEDKTPNDIYNIGTLTLNTAEGKAITLNGGITGAINEETKAAIGALNVTGAGTVNMVGGLTNQATTVSGGTLDVSGATVDNSRITIANGATLTSDNKTLFQNGSYTGNGGAIANSANDTVISGTFKNNSASSNGGAVYNTGKITIADDTLF